MRMEFVRCTYSVIAWNQKDKKERKRTMKRFLACLMVLLMTISLLPSGGWAEPVAEGTQVESSFEPTVETQSEPAAEPAAEPELTAEPTEAPAAEPTEAPAAEPTEEPTEVPATEPTEEPVVEPTEAPTAEPTEVPTEEPTEEPTEAPTEEPAEEPTEEPTEAPTAEPEQRFGDGYVKIRRNTAVYTDVRSSETLGETISDAQVYAVVAERGERADEDWLKIVFDTQELRSTDDKLAVGYVRFKSVEPLNEAETEALVTTLEKDTAARKLGQEEILIPLADFKFAVEDEPQPTEVPEATEALEATEEPEVTEAPEATEVPEATEAPEATLEPEETLEPETTEEPEISEESEDTSWMAAELVKKWDMTLEELADKLGISVEELETLIEEELGELSEEELEDLFGEVLDQRSSAQYDIGTCATSSSEVSASAYMYFYSQYLYTSTYFPDGHTLANTGCGMFAYAHAIQKLTNTKRNSSNYNELINTLKDSCNCSYDGRSDGSLANYDSYVRNLGARAVSTSSLSTESGILSHFAANGVAVVNIPGHYILAVGAERCDIDGNGTDELWIHIVDGAPQSTFYRMNQTYGQYPYSFDQHKAISGYSKSGNTHVNGYYNGTKRSVWNGGEYWVSYSAFKACSMTWRHAYLPGENTSTPASAFRFVDVTYPKTFQINTTYGWALGSGTVESNVQLTSIRSQILNSSGSAVSDSGTRSISGYSYTIKNLDDYSNTDNGVRFSYIKSAGSYRWVLTATDSSGRTLTLDMPFTVVSSGSTSTATAGKDYEQPVTGVSLSNSSISLKTGESYTLTATVSPSNATNKNVSWSSSDTSVATVSGGTVRAVGPGTATITCTSSANSSCRATCSVTVTQPVTGVYLSSSSLSMKTGESYTLTATVSPSNASNKNVYWSSSDTSVATVSGGTVRAIGPGTATITCTSSENGNYRATCTVTVTSPLAVYSVSSSKATTTALIPVTITATTPANGYYLALYSESGALVKSWSSSGNSTVSGDVRTWKVQYAFASAGSRRVTLKVSADNVSYVGGRELAVNVLALPAVTSGYSSKATTTALIPVTLTATTPVNGYCLSLYSEDGTKVKTWNCDGNSTVSGDVRTWKVQYAFGGAGDRRVTLKASADSTHYGSGRVLAVNVLALPTVTSVYSSKATTTAQIPVTITATTPVNGYCLSLYSEDGTKVKTWNCDGNSTVSGDVRTWKVQYAFGGAGDRRVTLKASADSTHYGSGRVLAVNVLALPTVTSANTSVTTVATGTALTITATTPVNGYCLSLYSEDGTKVKTWNCDGNSTVSGSVRTWKVQYAFGSAGDRRVTLKASADSTHYGSGKVLAVKVLSGPSVLGAAFSSTTVKRGEKVNIIVMAPAEGNYLHMYLENGQLYKTWAYSGNSSVSGGNRIWNIPYSFSGAGTRQLTFRVSTDGVHVGAGMTATITVK